MKMSSKNLNINLRHLRAMQAIAQQGSFSAAAAALGIVPSALSEIVRQLEVELGATLFDHSHRPPVITPFGRDFLAETAPLLEGMDRSLTRLRQNAGLQSGALSIGAAPSAISDLVVPHLRGFLADHPGIRCLVHDDIAERLAERVAEGALDLAFAGRVRVSPDLHQHQIGSDPVGLACAANHPLIHRDRITLDDLPPGEMIALDALTGSQRLLEECPQIPPALLTPRLRAHSTIAQLCMIRAGLGIGLLPQNAVELLRDPGIRFLPVQGRDLHRRLFLLRPARRPPSVVAAAFVSRISTVVLKADGIVV